MATEPRLRRTHAAARYRWLPALGDATLAGKLNVAYFSMDVQIRSKSHRDSEQRSRKLAQAARSKPRAGKRRRLA